MVDTESILGLPGGVGGGATIRRRRPGTALPAQARAQQTAQNAGGRLRLINEPQAPGVGEPAPTGRQQTGNFLTRLGGALTGQQSVIPSATRQPLSAIGLLLSNVAAGLRGQQLPSERLMALHQEERTRQLQEARITFQTITEGAAFLRRVPPGQRDAAADRVNEVLTRVLPDFDIRDFTGSGQAKLSEVAPDLQTLTPEAQQLVLSATRAAGGDAQAMLEVTTDPRFMERVRAFDDEQNRSSILAKRGVLLQALQQAGVDPRQVSLGLGEFEAVNQQLPPQLQLTRGEMRTLRGDVTLQQSFGIESPSLTQFRQQEQIRRQVSGGAGPELATVTVQFPDGDFRTFRRDDPELDNALNEGAVQVGLSAVGTPRELGQPTTATRSRAFESVETAEQTLGMINDFRSLVDQADLGVAADVRRLAQGAGAQAQAFSSLLGGTAQQTIRQIEQRGDDIAPGIFALDPGLSASELLGNIMAYQLAVQQQGGGRVSDQDFRAARDALGIDRPLANIGDVMQKLDLLERQTIRQVNQANKTLGREQRDLPGLPRQRESRGETQPQPQVRTEQPRGDTRTSVRRIVPDARSVDDAATRISRMNANQLAGINVDDLNRAPPAVQEAFRRRVEQLLQEEQGQNRTDQRTEQPGNATRQPFLGLGGF